ncbi:MAG: MFS transporter [Candidatus Hodarchaeota archaeon]
MGNQIQVKGEKPQFLSLKVILPVTSLGVFMGPLDGSIVNVALVTISKMLNTDMAGVRWIVIVYLLVMSAAMGLSGNLGDNFGRRRIFNLGLGLFVLGSLFCALSFTLELLILSRILQAFGAAGVTANGLAILMFYTEPRHRGRAIGFNSLVVATALISGPILGGVLTQFFGWPMIFLINIPIGVLAIILSYRLIPETPKKEVVNFDYLGVALFAMIAFAFVGGLLFFFEGLQLQIWNWGALLLVFLAIGLTIIFVYIESNHPSPMISISLLKNKKILIGLISAAFCYMAVNGTFFLLPFFYQEILLFTPGETGILLIVSPIIMAVSGPLTGLLAERFEARKLATLGAFLQGLFILILATINPQMALITIILLVALSAGSLAIFTNSNGTSVMNASPKTHMSTVSGLLNLSRTIAFATATGLSSAFFGLFFAINNPTGATSGLVYESAYYQSLGITFTILALFALVGMIVSFMRGRETIKRE